MSVSSTCREHKGFTIRGFMGKTLDCVMMLPLVGSSDVLDRFQSALFGEGSEAGVMRPITTQTV